MNEIVLSIVSILITGILTLLGIRLNDLLKEKHINTKTLNCLKILSNLIVDSIKTTQEVYVDNLKNKNLFDKKTQEAAFNMTKDYVINNLPSEVLNFLQEILPDLDEYIKIKVESTLNELREKK